MQPRAWRILQGAAACFVFAQIVGNGAFAPSNYKKALRQLNSAEHPLPNFVSTSFHADALSVARRRNLHYQVRSRVTRDASDTEDETKLWQEAYELELDRSELLNSQLDSELSKLGEISQDLKGEYEGCLLDLDTATKRPETSESDKWAEAYTNLRRCNEQLELKLEEVKSTVSNRAPAGFSTKPSLTMTVGPIRYKGIKFKELAMNRYFREKGSSFYFVELEFPLGIKMEESIMDIEGPTRVVQVTEIADGSSAAKDGRVKVGDFLRAVTVVKEKPRSKDAEIRGFPEKTKAVMIIPASSKKVPFPELLAEMKGNQDIDEFVGLVLERPYK